MPECALVEKHWLVWYLGSLCSGRALVSKSPARCPFSIGNLAFISHIPNHPQRFPWHYTKQAKAGQDDVTICLQPIQSHSGATSHATPELKQVWAEFNSLADIAGIQTHGYPYSLLLASVLHDVGCQGTY